MIRTSIAKLLIEPIQKRKKDERAKEPITIPKRGSFLVACNFPTVIEQRV